MHKLQTGEDNRRSSVDSGASSGQISRPSSVHLDNNVRLNTSFLESTQLEKVEASTKSSWNYKPGRSTSARNSPRLSVDNRGDASILSKELSRPSLDSRQTGRLSLDIRDVVRDSFYRDSPKLSLETKLDEKSQSRDGHKYVLKPMDSPRPPINARDTSKQQQQLSISPSSRNGQKPKSQFQSSSDINIKSRKSVSQASSDVTKMSTRPIDLNESLKVLVKLREAPWNFVENKEPPRPSFELKEGPRFSFSKDSPRFSYDGRDIPRSSSLKLREAPRLSLDSREISRNSVELKSNSSSMDTPKIMHKHRHSNGDLIEVEQQCSERKRSPSVVARLMGLEEMPADSTPTSQKTGALYLSQSEEISGFRISPEARKSFQYCKAVESAKQATEKEKNLLDSLKKHHFQTRCIDERSEPIEETIERVLESPRSIQSLKSPSLRHLDAIPKPILMQRCPIEPAPWRQQDGCQSYQRKAFESQNFSDVPKRNERSSQVLYSEIEKRLKQLEHEHCGKDLKTLKQILEAMHHKGLLDSTKEKFNHHENDFYYTPSSRNSQEGKTVYRAREMQDNQLRFGRSNSARAFQAPIVIMKPANVNKSSNSSVIPLDGFPNHQRKVSSVPQPGSPNTKRSTMGNNRALKDQQSGRDNSRGSASHYNNDPIAVKNNRREHNSRTKSIENSNDVLQKGTARPLSPASSPSTRNQPSSKEIPNSVKNNHPSCSTAKIQRKKPEIERKPRQSGSLKSSRQGTKQIGSETENRSPRNCIRTKGGKVMQADTMSESSRDTGADQCPETPRADEISVRSDSNISSISQMDYEVTSKLSDVNADYDCRLGNGNQRLLQSNGSVTDSHPKMRRTLEFRIQQKVRLQSCFLVQQKIFSSEERFVAFPTLICSCFMHRHQEQRQKMKCM